MIVVFYAHILLDHTSFGSLAKLTWIRETEYILVERISGGVGVGRVRRGRH